MPTPIDTVLLALAQIRDIADAAHEFDPASAGLAFDEIGEIAQATLDEYAKQTAAFPAAGAPLAQAPKASGPPDIACRRPAAVTAPPRQVPD